MTWERVKYLDTFYKSVFIHDILLSLFYVETSHKFLPNQTRGRPF